MVLVLANTCICSQFASGWMILRKHDTLTSNRMVLANTWSSGICRLLASGWMMLRKPPLTRKTCLPCALRTSNSCGMPERSLQPTCQSQPPEHSRSTLYSLVTAWAQCVQKPPRISRLCRPTLRQAAPPYLINLPTLYMPGQSNNNTAASFTHTQTRDTDVKHTCRDTVVVHVP